MSTREKISRLQELGFKMSFICKETGISAPMISAYIKGRRNCSADFEQRIELAISKILRGLV